MSEPLHITLAGASGLIGGAVIRASVGRADIRLGAVCRRELALPAAARIEVILADADKWGEALAMLRPQVLVCALGTTWARAGRSEAGFRAVDEVLVLETLRAAKAAGAQHCILVSSVEANMASRNFYLRVKGEVEAAAQRMGWRRLDILRPGLLRGARDGDRRWKERAAIMLSPLSDMLLQGDRRRFRSISADVMAAAILALAKERAAGRFIHEHDALIRVARRGELPGPL